MASVPTRPVVLLVQPHDDSREMYAEYFRHHDVDIVIPSSAAEAFALAATTDVVVTGLLLPGPADGYEFITRLRGDERTRAKPIIVLTAWAWQTEKLRAEEAGCDLFLTKPCLPAHLLRHVQRLIQKTKVSGRSRRQRPMKKSVRLKSGT